MSAPHQLARVLIVDDEEGIRASLATIFAREGVPAATVADGEQALAWLRQQHAEVLLTDLVMPGLGGLDLLRTARSLDPDVEVILMTAYATVDSAVEALRAGAYDFITKPLKRHEVMRAVRRALEHRNLVTENRALRDQLAAGQGVEGSGLVVSSPAMQGVLKTIEQAAPTDVTVLLTGESGTGKEVLARLVHDRSRRATRPFIAVNCAALPESILESELFGHERGAFTGASERREGRFMRAHGGTLFLDEVGEMSPALQVKLLRVLQDGRFDRVGGQETLTADVRLLAATNVDLRQAVSSGRFREDLFYRLNVITIAIPPLRERREDIPPLAARFVRSFARKHGRPVGGISDAALRLLEGHAWPGNVRELENTIERAVVLAQAELLGPADLPEAISAGATAAHLPAGTAAISIPWGTPLEEVERLLIRETLRRTGGDKRLTATLLGIATRTIYRKLGEERED